MDSVVLGEEVSEVLELPEASKNMYNPKEIVIRALLLIGIVCAIYVVASMFSGKNNSDYNIPQGCVDYGDGRGCY